MRRIRGAMTVAFVALLAGCAQAPQAGQPGPAATLPGAPPLDAALVTPAFGWVLTPDQLFTTRDGGATFTSAQVPVATGGPRTAHFTSADTGLVAAAAGDVITVASTADGGGSWHATTVAAAAAGPGGYSWLRSSFGDKAHGAIIARSATSQAFSLATIITTTDGGTTWSAHQAPEAGTVLVEPGGRIWIAGAALNSSDDHGRSWTPASVQVAGPAAAVTFSPPLAATLPVTVLAGERTEVQLLSTADGGRSWSRPSRVAVHGRTGPGVRVAVAATSAGPMVFDTVGGHAYRDDGLDVRPSGLPDGVHTVTFATGGQRGWALAGHGTCGSGKRDCRYHDNLLVTADRGLTWTPLAAWSSPR